MCDFFFSKSYDGLQFNQKLGQKGKIREANFKMIIVLLDLGTFYDSSSVCFS
jgi:hypothetical protein